MCDDGRAKAVADATSVKSTYMIERMVHCDLGTDCDDCGPWQPSGPVPWWVGVGEGRGGGGPFLLMHTTPSSSSKMTSK